MIAKLMSFLSSIKGYLIGAAASTALLFYVGVMEHRRGVSDQRLTQAHAETAAIEKGVKTRGTIEKNVNKLSDPDLDGQLDLFMRD